MTSSTARWLERIAATAAIATLIVVAVARTGEEVARGSLLEFFDSYEVARVRILGAEVYVDRSAGLGDLLTAGALGVAAVLLLLTAERLAEPARRAFATAGWGALFLAADDVLSAHETIGHNLPALASLPLVDHPDDVVLAVYAAVVGAFSWHHRRLLDGADRRPWIAAAACAALALLHDLAPLHLGVLEEALEVSAAVALAIGVAEVARRQGVGEPRPDAPVGWPP